MTGAPHGPNGQVVRNNTQNLANPLDYRLIMRALLPALTEWVIEGKEPGKKWTTGDYTIDEKHKSAALTEEGVLKVERLLGISNLYDAINMEMNHHVQA